MAHNLHWFLAAHVLPAPDVLGEHEKDPANKQGEEKFAKVSAAGARAVEALMLEVRRMASDAAFSVVSGDGPGERLSPFANPEAVTPDGLVIMDGEEGGDVSFTW